MEEITAKAQSSPTMASMVPTMPAVEIELLPNTPPARNPAHEVMEMQRGFKKRLVPFEKGNGLPFVKPKADPEKVKAWRKLMKRIRRGRPIQMPATSPKPTIE